MAYIKKLLLVKEVTKGFSTSLKPLSGVATIEIDGSAEFSLSLINLKRCETGYYLALIEDSDKVITTFNLGSGDVSSSFTLNELPNLKKGFCLGVFYIKENTESLICFGTSSELNATAEEMKNKLSKTLELSPAPTVTYDDEAVATENYYDYGDNDEFFNKTDDAESALKGKEEEKTIQPISLQDETDVSTIQETCGRFYDKVKSELDDLFNNYPPEHALNKSVPKSKWVRVKYSEDKYYTVGLVFDDKTPEYICYGVPGTYSKTPPETLKGYASFLPLSLFDLEGDGYWVLYQSAKTGKCVKIDFY